LCDAWLYSDLGRRFGRIIYLYNTEEGIPRAHVTWYEPASKTSLKELAHPQELILVDLCDNIDAAAIIRPLDVRRLAIDENEPDTQDSESTFFYRFDLNNTPSSFLKIPIRYYWQSTEDDTFLDVSYFLPQNDATCPSCRNKLKEQTKGPQRIEKGVRINKMDYHVKDFVYILPEGDGQVYHIGQIKWLSLTSGKVHVRLFSRSPKIPGQSEFYDDVRPFTHSPLRY
jgi:DNA (cytosine-5)-methyltransferase 1